MEILLTRPLPTINHLRLRGRHVAGDRPLDRWGRRRTFRSPTLYVSFESSSKIFIAIVGLSQVHPVAELSKYPFKKKRKTNDANAN